MRKKHRIYQSPTVKIQPLPKAFVPAVSVSNLQEQKTRFLKHGKTPIFVVEGDTSTVEELAAKSSGKIRFDLLGEAEYILRTVKLQYGKGENYLEHIYGPRVEQNEANKILLDYLQENSLQESLSVYWSNDMPCSARMTWKGYSYKCNKPEARRYSLWLNGTRENPYLRRHGLWCLLDHEIGTHFYRSFNDGFQPWFYDRKKFGLRGTGSFESLCTEEGLASINTTLRAKERFLWLSALTYYTACKSTEMTFKQLFDHLGQFLDNPEQRWKHVMRVKRGLVDPNDLGGYGKDQCYFEGAVTILRNIDNINFNLLMSGKICYDEVSRVKRVARLGSVCLPAIMRDMDSYRQQLKEMAAVNGLHLVHPVHEPPRAYVQRLKERQAGMRRRRKLLTCCWPH
ncbi:microtubule-associated tyrosine carboxypeptidase 1-like isoform X2 [Babylonia areolata]|uniref:microtubule-associated tyrosine carboxypeptidase 1-like isoform X2 n=1 Tax=Babylonia areolata TaxID=304850 RepID=UPI003FCEE933